MYLNIVTLTCEITLFSNRWINTNLWYARKTYTAVQLSGRFQFQKSDICIEVISAVSWVHDDSFDLDSLLGWFIIVSIVDTKVDGDSVW